MMSHTQLSLMSCQLGFLLLASTSGCGGPPACDDNDPCTTDTRDPVSGCVYTPLDCDDGNSCTTDTCIRRFVSPPSGLFVISLPGHTVAACIHTLIGCDEGFFCSGEETCVERICRATTFDCDDGVGCVLTGDFFVPVCRVLCDGINCTPVAQVVSPTISAPYGSTVCLNGAPSFDVDGDVLSFKWTQVTEAQGGGPPVALSNPDTAEACFVAPPEGQHSQARFELTVDDGNGGSDRTHQRVNFFQP